VVKLMTPYLWPMRFGDYSTILKYFAIWSALADFGVYVIALRELGVLKKNVETAKDALDIATNLNDPTLSSVDAHAKHETAQKELGSYYNKFVTSRLFMICLIYTIALVIAYLLPAYTNNPYLVRWLPLGMLFSASFMTAGILQLPLQLFWKMEQVSIALIVARVVQLTALIGGIYMLYPHQSFEPIGQGIPAFVRVLISVLLSGLAQTLYVLYKGNKILPLRRERDSIFTRSLMKKNRQYGFAYYLSSFHTLIVLILLSNFFPTIQGHSYVGIRALALSLIEILLIVPSALGNSLIHRVSHADTDQKRKSFWGLMSIIIVIWLIVIANFSIFHTEIIRLIGGTKYLSTATQRWSDMLLPFLAIVLTLSFIKQVFNYIFVSVHRQNALLLINLIGVIVGISIGIPLIQKYNLIWWIATQLLLEICFTTGSLIMATKRWVLPKISRKHMVTAIMSILFVSTLSRRAHTQLQNIHLYQDLYKSSFLRLLTCTIMNGAILALLRKPLKVQARLL